MTPPTEEYKVIKPNAPLEAPYPRERVIYIERTLENLNFAENGSIEECVFLGCNIKSMEIIKSFGLDTELTFRKCIFYGCTIDSMEIQGEKIKEISGLSFINCYIKNLVLDDIYAPGICFMDCDINNSTFKYSTIPGLTFTKFDQEQFEDIIDKTITGEGEKANEAKKQIRRYSRKHKHKRKSEIRSTEFLFCELNGPHIEETKIAKTIIRHCHLQYLKIFQNVVMRDVDLRGTKIVDSDLGPNKFQHIRFNKGVFLVDIIIFFWIKILKLLENVVCLIAKLISRKIDAQEKVKTIKQSIKKVFYKNFLWRFLANAFSPTKIKNTFYEKADFSNDYHFFLYILHLEYVDDLTKLSPKRAFLSFITTNYMRSIGGLLGWSFILIFVFSLVYSSYGRFCVYPQNIDNFCLILKPVNEQGHPVEPFNLSFKIFMNNDLYPLEAQDNFTKNTIICEVLLGYLVLGVFVGMLTNILSQRLYHYTVNKERVRQR